MKKLFIIFLALLIFSTAAKAFAVSLNYDDNTKTITGAGYTGETPIGAVYVFSKAAENYPNLSGGWISVPVDVDGNFTANVETLGVSATGEYLFANITSPGPDDTCGTGKYWLTTCEPNFPAQHTSIYADWLSFSYTAATSSPTSTPAAQTLGPLIIPSSTGSGVIGFIGSQLGNPGFYLILVLVIGLPLAFVVARRIKNLIPKK
jgi:hypothetical protein